ncbi:inter-alpha-trypsin inhibitor heavy chain H4-like isoform X2 [Dromiciops gliroides]|uniref:inter-alpha-trypsin inhibitor heavy chain H4-like isoform X2 n=1 Tax=Dromiciops gliroides TaxID=33562 RepID=UPI001CC761DD|nr:inter-alpha-trypsin inhibitor heavy chain H4-like isoform X2 [Dromiciops gliroides]
MKALAHTLLLAILFLLLASFSPIAAQEDGIDFYSLTMDSKITSRFAHTTITSHVVNKAEQAQEVTFQVEMPQTAFITNFSMIVDGVIYPAEMQEKAAAEERFLSAVAEGQSARIIKATGRNLEQFQVSVDVAPASNATFELVYEELLKRHLGKYELMLKVQPQQLVKHLQIDIHIFEPQGISSLDTEISFMTKDLADALTTTQNKTKAHIVFKPSLAQQQKEPGKSDTILDGNFIVHYDVDRTTAAGDMQIENGYFVHHFAPRELPLLPKNVVFVIDRSGSMTGKKIKKTREALVQILDDLKPEDHFNLVAFNAQVMQWKPMLLQASKEHLESAKTFLSNTQALGATNIHDAILVAVRMLDNSNRKEQLPEGSVSMVILLTDGDPTEGEKIRENVKVVVNGQCHLYCVGFGFDVNYAFLEKLALDNGGVARRIYEDSDADLQLQDFYQEVANPLLTMVKFQYPDNAVELLTQDNFRVFFKGSELVVAGKLQPQAPDLFSAQVKGHSHTQNFTFQTEVNVVNKEKIFQGPKYISHSFMERLWAYLTIQQLLEKAVSASGTEQLSLQARALDLSLNFSFVTPLTCMVVNQPRGQGQPRLAMKPVEIVSDHAKLKTEKPMKSGRMKFRRRKIISQEPTELKSRLAPLEDVLPGTSKPLSVGTPMPPSPVPLEESLKSMERAPHFILPLITHKKNKEILCVDVKGSPFRPLSLISDPVLGIEVTGHYKDFLDTFSWLQVSYRTLEVQVYVTQDSIIMIRGSGQHRKSTSYQWQKTFFFGFPGLKLALDNRVLRLTAPGKVTICMVSLSHFTPGLHLFLQNPVHFSGKVSGILGQFYQHLYCSSLEDNKMELTAMGKTYTITRKYMLDYQDGEGSTSMPTLLCWSLEQSL